MKAVKEVNISKIIAVEIRKRRKKFNLSQRELSKKAGLYKSSINYLEQGKANPSVFTLYKIANALKIGLHYLIKDIN